MHEILGAWLGFPQDKLAFIRARFIHTIALAVSPDILYLRATNDAFVNMPSFVFGSRHITLYKPTQLKSFVDQLLKHPSSQDDSSERRLLNEIGAELNVYYSPVSALRPPSWSPVHLSLLSNFVKKVAVLIDIQGEVKNQGSLVHDMSIHRDFYLPFREHGPSRLAAVHSNPGPFHPEFVRTRAGFFSALIYCAVTFGAPMVYEDHKVFFSDLDDWNSFYVSGILRQPSILSAQQNDIAISRREGKAEGLFCLQPSIRHCVQASCGRYRVKAVGSVEHLGGFPPTHVSRTYGPKRYVSFPHAKVRQAENLPQPWSVDRISARGRLCLCRTCQATLSG